MAFSYFFRDIQTLERTLELAAPKFMGRSRIRVWDAGCAMGQECYTIAILLAENLGYFSFKNVTVDATDIDTEGAFGDIVRSGVYSGEVLKRIPRPIFNKYFTPVNMPGHYRVIDEIRSKISFRRHDLLSLKPPREDYSLVVCKNVLLHLQPPRRADVYDMFHRALVPAGILATEQTQKLPPGLNNKFKQVVPDAQVFERVSPASIQTEVINMPDSAMAEPNHAHLEPRR